MARSGDSQSAAERKAAESELRRLLSKFTPASRRQLSAVRRWLRKTLPSAHEIVYGYTGAVVISVSPSDRGYEGVFALRADEDGLRLYFNFAKDLPDPERLLQGSGKQTRWIAVPKATVLDQPAVGGLINAAIARTKVPFPHRGDGPVLLAARQSKKRKPSPRA